MSIAHILKSEAQWCKNATALNAEDEPVEACDEKACRWCMFGAFWKAHRRFGDSFWRKWDQLLNYVKQFGYESIGHWNDDPRTTFADVRRAIKVCNL